MPQFYELYGASPSNTTAEVLGHRKLAHCPFTGGTCDGGGNRHQTKIKLTSSVGLRAFFDPRLDSVIPGVCSIDHGDAWIVCPRRLLGFNPPIGQNTQVNYSLQSHERTALLGCGLPSGIDLGIWSEVYLQYKEDDTSINYHFDFVISKLKRNYSFGNLLRDYNIVKDDECDLLVKSARKGGYITGRYDPDALLPILPDLSNPTIIEVMTASTSGSDTEEETDIAAAFGRAILGNPYECPGINKRQVWGRMATQLFAKSALAEHWGGKTVWLVQNQLLRDIELTTKLNLSAIPDATSETINFLSMKFLDGQVGIGSLEIDRYCQKRAGISFAGGSACADILLPKVGPSKAELLKSVLRRGIASIVRL